MLSVDLLKTFLNLYRQENIKLETYRTRLEELDTLSRGVSSPTLDGMPHGGGITDRTGRIATKIIELMETIDTLEDEADTVYKSIDSIIDLLPENKVDNIRGRAVLSMRYLDLMPWESVNRGLFGGMPDFEARHDSYYRRTTKLHGRALIDLLKVIEQTDKEGEILKWQTIS